MGKPAARITDMHVCPMVTGIVPHVGGPIIMGEFTVLTGMLPQARMADPCVCVGPPDMILMGSPTVLVGGRMAARMGDPTVHGGTIVLGCFTVLIGEAAGGGGGAAGGGAAAPPAPKTAADFTLSNATLADEADLEGALIYLQASPTGAAFLATVPKGTKIEIIHDGNDRYSPSTDTVYWDPASGLAVASGDGNQSAALGLLHELDHKVNGLENPVATGDGYDDTEERRAITGTETTVAKELGEPTRTDHRGTAVTLGSATEHTSM